VLVERLHAFGRFWRSLDADVHLDQTAVDHALQALRAADSPTATVRKGRSPVTADAISEVLRATEDALTAAEVADSTGVSRATAQRYLADLARDGRVQLTLRYGSTGRPEHCFEWLGRRR
jgi:response regulator of citrate/malate metabolism